MYLAFLTVINILERVVNILHVKIFEALNSTMTHREKLTINV